jgi:hypothetical protein
MMSKHTSSKRAASPAISQQDRWQLIAAAARVTAALLELLDNLLTGRTPWRF